MKKAVIVVGRHHAGKGKTIRLYLKPKLGIDTNVHKFTRSGQSGYVLAQSFEEADKDILIIVNYSHYELLIPAARPAHETPSCLVGLKAKLEEEGYRVSTVDVVRTSNEAYYEQKAEEILSRLDDIGAKTASAS